jgi:Zn finger protein HypA/HybF involved in hydrogenase expression
MKCKICKDFIDGDTKDMLCDTCREDQQKVKPIVTKTQTKIKK